MTRTDGIIHIAAVFGFQDPTDFPEVLRRGRHAAPRRGIDLDQVSYFVSRISLRCTHRPGMAIWRKQLFIALAHNAASQAELLRLPEDRTIVLSAEVPRLRPTRSAALSPARCAYSSRGAVDSNGACAPAAPAAPPAPAGK